MRSLKNYLLGCYLATFASTALSVVENENIFRHSSTSSPVIEPQSSSSTAALGALEATSSFYLDEPLHFHPSGRIPAKAPNRTVDDNIPVPFQPPRLWKRIQIDASLGMLIRTGSLSWNIASDVSGKRAPNILSELTYDGLKIRGLELQTSINFSGGLLDGSYLNARINRGIIADGETKDSDYHGNNRTQEYSRSLAENTGDYVSDYSVAYGYHLSKKYAMSIDLLAGYSFHRQYVRKRNAIKVEPESQQLNVHKIEGLNSTYQSEWQGPWLGASLVFSNRKQFLELRGEVHSAIYYAEADWNLRQSFMHPKSFEHNADGFGGILDLTYTYTLGFDRINPITFGISYRIESWKAENGMDTLYLASGDILSTKLNEVNWFGEAISLQVKLAH